MTEKRMLKGNLSFRSEGNGKGNVLTGYAVKFNEVADVGGNFYEKILPNAITGESISDVALCINHDGTKLPLARYRADNPKSTLNLEVDNNGLKISAELDAENNQDARALYSSVKRGDICGMSFAFVVDEDEWQVLQADKPLRIIKRFKKIYDVSAVTFPQYEGTEIDARNKSKGEIKMTNEIYDERTAAVNGYNNETGAESPKFVQGKGFTPVGERGRFEQSKRDEARETQGRYLKENVKVKSPLELRTVTVDAGSVVVPQYDSATINPTFKNVSSLVDSVAYLSLNGGESFEVPYVVNVGAGGYTAETADYNLAETEFGFAEISRNKITAYSETSEELLKLPAANYADVIFQNIKESIREVLASEILLGTGENKRITGIFSDKATAIDTETDLELAGIDDTTLDEIIFSYGGKESVENSAVLILNRRDLMELAKVRTADTLRYYDIKTNGTGTGTINGVPFIINSACKALSGATTAAGEYCMAYGSLKNYQLVEFSPLTVVRSDDFKFRSGITAFRGSVFIGGNVVKKNGFLRVKKK